MQHRRSGPMRGARSRELSVDEPRTPQARRWWHLDPGGAALGLVFAILSVTPSLLPRPAAAQGAITALSFGAGYLIGVLLWRWLRRLIRPEQQRLGGRAAWIAYGAAMVASIALLSGLSLHWQNDVRRMVEMPEADSTHVGAFLAVFVPLTVVLLAIGKGVRRLSRRLRGRFSPLIAGVVTTSIVAGVALAGGAGALAVVDSIFSGLNSGVSAEVTEPGSAHRSAGPDSAIAWESLGHHGSDFVGGGPSAARIEAVTGLAAREPIRVYAGLESAPTDAARADLVLAELERTGAFDRSILVVATTTGSGWLEPQTVDALEYLHAGDTAIASMQYSYMPSWYSFLFDPDAPVHAARTLFDAVYERWSQLPADDRPMLVSYGLSLGAHGSQAVFADLADVRTRTDGALFVGSPNGSELWRGLQAARDAGSPAWQPVLDGGREVRWISRPGDDSDLPQPWQKPRVLYLQHATDAVTWLGPRLFWQSPDWLEPDQRGADVSPSMRWIPVVTGLQVLVDMMLGDQVPAHHGHNFGNVVPSAWRQVTGDAGLDAAAFARVQAIIEDYAPIKSTLE
ncbi:hypothetical protein GCE65_02800 [Pseudactinotalea sp. HY158]|nr:hypothetical protein GCE65_02800 [Pseudactinotalea sp. HY158]